MPRRSLLVCFLALLMAAPLPAASALGPGAREGARDAARERRIRDALPDAERPRTLFRRYAEARGDRLVAWRENLEERRARARKLFEAGRRGERVIRREILAIDPSERAMARARALSIVVDRQAPLDGLGMRMLVLRAPEGMTAVEALDALQEADPEGVFELNHVFGPSGASQSSPAEGAPTRTAAASASGVRIGMIDVGVDGSHPALARALVRQRAFPEGATVSAAPHGTAVASLLVGEDGAFHGALPGAELYAADVFSDRDDGGSAESIAKALGWMVENRVQVVNVSLAGPANRVLEAVCRRAASQGVVLVAAVGNDGPTSPVAFPAAYPSVVAVTAIDARKRIYVAANRGPEVAFASAGVGVRAALDGGGYADVSGTSFAAPMVAARMARMPDGRRTVDALAQEAVDLGSPGRDPVFGFGAV